MKNLLPILNNILEDRPKRRTKEETERYDRRYYRSWSSFLGKVASVNPENLLGLHHNEIVAKYLHTLPAMYRDLDHLYSYLSISMITRDGVFNDPIYGRRQYHWFGKRSYYYFNEDGILCVKRMPKRKLKSPLTKAERMKKFHEEKRARNKRDREMRVEQRKRLEVVLHDTDRKRKEKEEQINLQKIISHGFDPITSFRNHDKQ